MLELLVLTLALPLGPARPPSCGGQDHRDPSNGAAGGHGDSRSLPRIPSPAQEASGERVALPPPAERLAGLEGRLREAERRHTARYLQASSDAERTAIRAAGPAAKFAPLFADLARAAGPGEVADRSWAWVVKLARDGEEARSALEALLAGGASEVSEERADLRFSLAKHLLEWPSRRSAGERRAEARELLADLSRRTAAGEAAVLAARRRWHPPLERLLFELEHLQIGMSAPDFTAVDLQEVAFRLSDYREKVVVLHFWSFLDGPGASLIGQLNGMSERLAAEPFAVIGVNRDDDASVRWMSAAQSVSELFAASGISWRAAMDMRSCSPSTGSLSERWNATPSATFVLGVRGVIRHRDLEGQALEDAVAALLAEARTGR